MYEGYKVVCVTAAGRRGYMKYLIPMVLSSPLVDRYDLWVNTTDNFDVEFMNQVAERYDKVRLVKIPDAFEGICMSITSFWKTCDDKNTIYIRLDDDIVWMEPDFFEKILKFRVENPQYLFVYPMIINNAKCTYLLKILQKIKLKYFVTEECCDKVLWKSPLFAEELHQWFLDGYVEKGDISPLYFDSYNAAMSRISINSMVWFGEEVLPYCQTEYHEEIYYSYVLPTRLKRDNCVFGGTYMAHYAFYPQRWYIDRTNLLERYSNSLKNRWKNEPQTEAVYEEMEKIIRSMDDNKKEIALRAPVYPIPAIRKKLSYKVQQFYLKTVFPVLAPFSIERKKRRYKKYIVG